jgi:hypothetical protein
VWAHESRAPDRALAAHRNLGVFIDTAIALDESDRTEARVNYALERNFDPFASETDDYLSVSAPAANHAQAVAICRAFLKGAS